MLKRYGDRALEESAVRADELALAGDDAGAARIFNTAGDSAVADFASAVDAVQCAVAVQAAIATQNAGGTPMQFRIGVHVGDVIVDGSNLLGDSVNIAARLEALAKPGSIYVSAPARDHIGNKLPLAFDDLGDQQVKNIPQAIQVYRVQAETLAAKPSPTNHRSPCCRFRI